MSPIDSTAKDDHRIDADFDYVDTQPFDSDGGEDDVCGYFEDTVPFDDFLETEAVNLAGETQALDDVGETQLLEEESESDRTQVLENVDDDEVSVDGTQCVDSDNGQAVDSKKGESLQPNTSGLMPPRFTFLRAESLRQAALANRNMDLKQTQDETNSVMGTSQFCQELLAVEDNGGSFPRCSEKVGGVDRENEHGKYNVEIGGFKSKSMCKVANSTVRKLFNDDLPVETNGPSLSSIDCNEGDDLDKLPICHGDLGGLSYINSQEPGILSQDNALDFVDRFLEDNIMEFDQETNCAKNMEEKSKSVPSTKGQHSLAKRVNDTGKAGRTGIYDWDDSLEDEGGGDIYLRRKEDFFKSEAHRPRLLPGLQKSKVRRLNDDKEDKKQLSVPNKRKTAFHSDSRLGMHILKVRDNIIQESTIKLKRNLANELDEQFNTDCSRGEMELNANAGVQEMLDVGFDTQMAAEAMEALCNAEDIVDHVANDATHVTRSGLTYKLNNISTGKVGLVSSKERSGQYDRKRKVDVKSKLQTSGLSKKSTKEVRQCKKDNMMTGSKRSKLNAEGNQTSSANESGKVSSSPIIAQRKSAGALKRHQLDELNNPDGNNGEGVGSLVNRRQLQDDVWHFTPIARRTRRSLAINQLINLDIPSKSLRDGDTGIDSLEKSSGIGLQASKALDSKSTTGSSDHFEVDDNSKSCQFENLALKASTVSVCDDVEMDTLDCSKRRSIRIRKLSNHDKGSETLVGSSKPSAQSEDIGKSAAGKRKTRTDSVVKSHVNCQAHSSLCGGSVISSIDRKQGKISEINLDKTNPGDNINNSEVTSSDESPRERYKSSDLESATPAKCKTPVNDASPVCMGDEYYKQSCNTNLSRSCLLKVSRKELHRELQSLSAIRPELLTPSKDSRKRRDMTDVRILYSHHLDEDIIKHQKKILSRLGVSVASYIADATHFIADQFVRTRNMLEAIAFGKLVVTHLWIESCGQASCFIDERNYILRDAKKEKELGFSMPVSLARAIQHPLLEGRRVLITPNTKPSKEIISNLARAVQGQVVEKVGRSVLKGHKIPDDLLILSCEEDYTSCVPLLAKGAMVYSSELLLNGIVTQKLEYQRHRLFADNVKKTRSTLWLKRDDRTFIPVTKCN
ncbi:PAX-interacting protein 1 [Spatholobus suberectus]|nr:PAX-interacting protein 1 [Spatholobus suberectus]